MFLRNLFENLTRTGEGKSAVIGWGRGMGHKGHMFLASSVITQAKETNSDPYFVVSRTVGKDDPINPEEKLTIYKKVFPQRGHIFQTATEEMPDLTRVLTKLQDMGYTDVTVVVGADQVKALGYVKNYNGKPDKLGNIPFSFNSLNVISRQETNDPSREQEGPRATPMRAVLMDPDKSEEEKFAVWRDSMNPELSDEEVMDLMHKAEQRMKTMVKPKEAVAEAEGEPEGVKHISKELLTHIVQQVGTEGAHAIVKSLEWGDGAAAELLKLITQDLKQDIAGMKESTFKKSPYGRTAASQQRAKELLNPPKPQEPKKDEKTAEEGYGNHPSQRVDPRTGKKYVPPKSPLNKGTAEATGDKPFDNMMKNISKGTNKQKTADRKEQQKQTQQRARDAFGNMFGGGNPADKLKIREQGVAEADDKKEWQEQNAKPNWRGQNIGEDVEEAMAEAIARLIENQLK